MVIKEIIYIYITEKCNIVRSKLQDIIYETNPTFSYPAVHIFLFQFSCLAFYWHLYHQYLNNIFTLLTSRSRRSFKILKSRIIN